MEYVKDGTQKLSALAEGEVEKEGQKLEGRGSGLETGTQLQRRSAWEAGKDSCSWKCDGRDGVQWRQKREEIGRGRMRWKDRTQESLEFESQI